MRIDSDAVEVPGTASETWVSIDQGPGIPAVIGTIESWLFRLDQCVHPFAVRRHINAHSPPITLRETLAGATRPSLAGILRTIKTAAGCIDGSIGAPWRTPSMPGAGKQEVRI